MNWSKLFHPLLCVTHLTDLYELRSVFIYASFVLGLSNRLLACMFQLPDKRTVSRIIDSARQAILKDFVPYNLGFEHITRRDVIDHHTTTIARELMCGDNFTAIVVIDGTYIYIQVKIFHCLESTVADVTF